ncbi:ABC transporter permease [Allofournierella sp.]|uniref:ABC transporter permease n=1 Tax=Allofournierella sp. TaxID=1940256 RepID=UPI003AF07900
MKRAMGGKTAGSRRDVWLLISIVILCLYALFLIYPLFMVLRNAVVSESGAFTLSHFVKFFSKRYYISTMANSFALSVSVTAFSLLLGLPLAYFYNLYEIKGARVLQIFIILCSMSAPFVGAYSWILLLGRNGVITNLFKTLLGVTIPSIYGFHGIVLVLCSQMFPLVFLYVSGALRNVDNTLLEASENMGCSGAKRFFTVVIPLCAPSVIAAMLMVFMRAFADFGTPMFIGEGYRTFPVELYNSFISETGGDTHFAAALAVIAIVITALVFLIQRYVNNRFQFTMSALHPIERRKAKGLHNVLIHAFCYLVVLFGYAPQLYVIYTSFQNTSGKIFVQGYSLNSYREALAQLQNAIPNTFLIGGVALLFIVATSVLVAYLVVRRNNFVNRFIDTLSMIPYVIPGAVIGIAMIISFNKKPLVLVGTAAIMIIALVIRRNAYTIRSSVAILQQIPLSVEEAASSLGSSKLKTFFRVTMPMMGNGIISGALLSWIAIITELATGILLYNYRTTTLTIEIFTAVLRGNYGIAAAMACILTVMTTISLLLFMKISKNKDITF